MTEELVNDRERLILSALFARSNMGCGLPENFDPEPMLKSKSYRLDDAVTETCRDLLESDEMLTMFLDEAMAWQSQLRGMSRVYVTKTWPHIAAVMWPKDGGQ
jgi:hypothetical protein